MRRSYRTVIANQLRQGRLLWPLRQALKWPGHRLGEALGVPLAGPLTASFFTTYACNLRCQFCDYPYRHLEYTKEGRTSLDADERRRVVDDFASIGTTALGFTGGEPMLAPETSALIARAASLGMVTHLSSNGWAFRTREATERVFDLGLNGTTISLDGARPETHNAIRRSHRSFDEVMTALRTLLEVRASHANPMSVTTTTVITQDNYREIPQLVEMLTRLGVDQIGFMPVHDAGLDYDVEARSADFRVKDPEALDAVVDYLIAQKQGSDDRIENTVAYLELFKEAFRGKPLPIRCFSGLATLAVDEWGDIFPCFPWSGMRRTVGNVRATPLPAFWSSPAASSMRAEVRGCRECYWNNHTELNLMLDSRRSEPPLRNPKRSYSLPVPASVEAQLRAAEAKDKRSG